MRLLHGLGHDRNRADDSIVDAAAPFCGRVDLPRRFARRDAPVLPLLGEEILGPGLLDDVKILLEGGAIGGVYFVVLMWLRAVNSVGLLRHDVDPSPLIAAGEAGVGAATGHVIKHRDVFSDANRILRGQDDSELADAQALVCIAMYRSSITGLFDTSKPSTWK